MTSGISKRDAYQILLMLRGIEGIDIELNNTYYPKKDHVSIKHILDKMGYEKEREIVKQEI